MIRHTLYITRQMLSSLKEISQDGKNISEHIRQAITEYIEKKQKAVTSPSKKGFIYGSQ